MAQQLLCYVPRVLGFQNLLATCPKLPHAPVMLFNIQQFGSKLIDYVQLLFQNVTFPVWTFPILEGRLKQDAKLRQKELIALASVRFSWGHNFQMDPSVFTASSSAMNVPTSRHKVNPLQGGSIIKYDTEFKFKSGFSTALCAQNLRTDKWPLLR